MFKWTGWIAAGAILAACQALPLSPVDEGEDAIAETSSTTPPALDDRTDMPTASQAKPSLEGHTIIAMAHKKAGGESFVRPGTLFLSGYNILHGKDGGTSRWDKYAMWRVFADEKADAHAANGKVRIEAWRGSKLAMLLSFDGQATYDKSGRMADQSANAMWSNNFGFGAIRNALDEGWTQARRADRTIDGKPAYMVELTDPKGGQTLFGIDQSTFHILYVGFDTPRGWHERHYSHYFSKPGLDWQQAGRVQLFYNGVKANEAIWTDFEIGKSFDEEIFIVGKVPNDPTF